MLVAKSRIKHDGKVYEKGDELPKMTEKQLAALVDAGVVANSDDEVDTPAPAVVNDVSGTSSDVPNNSWTKARLLEYARENGIEVAKDANKTVIMEAISAASVE